jgi:antitoxin (DNA-binding transcriptional repressor) of toxin-antitoxin stability system
VVRIVNIRDAKTNLSRLVDQAARGESFIIAKAGKPIVPLHQPTPPTRLGFMSGQFTVPDDFDRMGQTEVEEAFGLDP